MIDLRDLEQDPGGLPKCSGSIQGGCSVLDGEIACGLSCPFYKPKGMRDWIRRGDNLIEPEEYKATRK